MAKKFYAVKVGRNPGVYQSWDQCKEQVDGYPNAKFQGFAVYDDAVAFVGGKAKTEPKPVAEKKQAALSITRKAPKKFEGVVIYTDGSCLRNPGGAGGYAAIIDYGATTTELVGSDPSTTNNRMEMMAAITALRALEEPTNIMLYTDSQYLRQGLTSWIKNWKRNGWKTKVGLPVLNQELWQELDRLNTYHRVTWNWVKGHNGNPLNERCDQLAVQAAVQAKKQ